MGNFDFDELKNMASMTNKCVIIKQDDFPITITRYESLFEEAYEATQYCSAHPDRVWHSLNFKNVTSNYIVAIRFGFASFDSFNCFLGHRRGSYVENFQSNSEYGFECTHEVPDADAFEKFGTGVVYIDAIRNEFGEIWKADLQMIIEAFWKYDQSVTTKDLKPRGVCPWHETNENENNY